RMRRLCNANSSNLQRNSNPSRLPGPAPWALIAQSRLADEMSKLNETDIQGFVLRGYNIAFARYVFLRFEDPVRARILIGQLLSQVTTGQRWDGAKPESTVNIAFTHHGLAHLELPDATLLSFPVEFQQG